MPLVVTHCRIRNCLDVAVGDFVPMNDCIVESCRVGVDPRDELIPVPRTGSTNVRSNTTHVNVANMEVAFNVFAAIADECVTVRNPASISIRQVRHNTIVGGQTGVSTEDPRQDTWPQSWPEPVPALAFLLTTGNLIDGPGDAVAGGYAEIRVTDTLHSGDLSGNVGAVSGNRGPELFGRYQDAGAGNYRLQRAGIALPDGTTYPLVDSPGVLMTDTGTSDAGAYHRGVPTAPALTALALALDSPRTLQVGAKAFGAEDTEGIGGWQSTVQGQADVITLEFGAEDASERQRAFQILRAARASTTAVAFTRRTRALLPLDSSSPEVIRLRSTPAEFSAWQDLFRQRSFVPGAATGTITDIVPVPESTLSYPGEVLYSGVYGGTLPAGAELDWLDGSLIAVTRQGTAAYTSYNTTGNVNPAVSWPDIYMVVGTNPSNGRILLDPVHRPAGTANGYTIGFNRCEWMGTCRVTVDAFGRFTATINTDAHLQIPGLFDGCILHLPYTTSLAANLAAGTRINVDTTGPGLLPDNWWTFALQPYAFRLTVPPTPGAAGMYSAEPVHPANPIHDALNSFGYASMNASLFFGVIHTRFMSPQTDDLEAATSSGGDQWGGMGGEWLPGWRSARYRTSLGWGAFSQTLVTSPAPRSVWPFGRTR